MTQQKCIRSWGKLAMIATAFLAMPVLAQQEVNNQANPAGTTPNSTPQPQAGQRVNGELYGNSGPAQPARHYQSTLLPSEQRYIIERAGVTPSELRAQADRVGPLSPEGPLAYIPLQSPMQHAVGAAQLQLVNPAYANQLIPRQLQSPPPPGSPAAVQPGVLHPTEPAPTANLISPPRLDAGRMLTPPPGGSITTGESTVSYRIPAAHRPATAPATQPSISPGEQQ